MKIVQLQPNPSRAAELESRLMDLGSIEPVLSSNYLVKGWLDRGCLSVIYGPSNAGKTFVALDLAAHVAANQPWRGLKVNGGPVLYIANEGGAGVRNRLAAIKKERPELAKASFALLPTNVDLHGNGDAFAICDALPFDDLALIVVDTLARSMGSGDENTAKDMALFIRNCDIIRQWTDAHVMLIHHTGKDEGRGARGSSALRAAVDNEIQVTAKGEILSRKQRDQEAPKALYFKLRPVTLGEDKDGDPVTSAVVDATNPPKPERKSLKGKKQVAMQALCDALNKHGELKKGDEYPCNRKVVHRDHWRALCDNHGLSSGVSDSAARMAFKRAKDSLMELDEVREWNDHVWRVHDDF